MGRQCWLKLQNENIACIFFKMICKYWNYLMLLFILSVKYGNGMPQSSISRPNVVNGIDASEPIPWQVSIRRNSEHICGGTILNENTVLSAAHCFFGFDYDNKILTTGKDNALQNNFTILAGIINREDSVSGQEIEVDGYIWPPMDYNPYSFTNDIIILKLKGNLVFSQKKVYAVSLPLEKTWGKYDSFEDCMISGWGRTTRHKSSQIPKILQWANVPTIANCNSVSNYTNLIESQICALNNGKTDACTGDSGGPLVCKSGFSGYVMTGVVSYGPRICGTPDYPGIYTRVGYFLDWIKDNMEKPVTVDCDWTSWSDWSSCSQTCGAGVRERSRQVKTTAQNDGSPINLRFGSPCSGSARQTESCNIQECPVDCLWSDWTKSGGCTKTCGGGFQYFERTMLVKSQNGGKSCTGSSLKRENCNDHNCPDTTTTTTTTTTVPKIDCQWSGWSKSGECTKSCGGGTQYFQRTISVQSKNGGKSCTGNPIKQEKCNDFDCPVDCRWNNWSDWTSCSKTCGQGSKNRRREVQTRARNGGSLCQGLSMQTQSCNVRDCPSPVNCQWSSWSETGPCSKSCGGGVQYFERTINVESQNGGQSCTGSRTKREYCNTRDCPCVSCNICGSPCRRDNQKEERLWNAAKDGDLATVKELTKTTFVDTTEGSSSGTWTPLIVAAANGHKDIVQILLDNGANIDYQDNLGRTALMLAAGNGHKDIVQILLDNGANINQQNNYGETALTRAALNGKKDVVQFLLDRGANTRLKTKYGDTACTWNRNVGNIIPSCN